MPRLKAFYSYVKCAGMVLADSCPQAFLYTLPKRDIFVDHLSPVHPIHDLHSIVVL